MQLLNESQVLDTWMPILEEKTGIKEGSKLKWMSKYAHYHSLNEGFSYPQASLFNTPGMGNVAPATSVAGGAANFYGAGAQGSGDKFPSLLPLAIQVAARTVGFDIVNVVPMNGPSGVLTYLDYVYAGGRDPLAPGLNNQTNLGGTANANVGNKFTDKFQVFKLNPASFGSNLNTSALWKVQTAGSYYVFASLGTTGAMNALLAQFVGLSRVDGFPIFRAIGEVNNSTLTIGAASTAQILDFSNGQNQLVAYYNVIGNPATTFVFPASSVSLAGNTWSATTAANVANDNFNAGATTSYVELVRAMEDHIQGFAGAGPQDNQAFSGNATNGLTPYEPMRRGIGETS